MNLDKEDIKLLLLKSRCIMENGCWYWLGLKASNNYGKIYINRKLYSTHRLSAYVYLDFDLNSKLQILHKCDIRFCFNPEHLFAGTAQDNQDDFFSKGFKRRVSNQYMNKEVTKCIYGHDFTKENTGLYKGTRYCKKCKLKRQKIYRSRR